MKPLLAINDLQFSLGEFTLGELSLQLDAGDYLVLLGPSGCGKTTLLRAIAGAHFVEPDRIFLNGKDVGRVPPQGRHIAYVAQSADLFAHMDVAGNIAFGLRYLRISAGQKRRRMERIVSLLELGGLLHRSVTTLSGGESRRVALARSLVVDPQVLLLDEPLSMLDPNVRSAMRDILKMIHHELGATTIHVTHDREEAWAIEGRCAVMRGGRIEQVGGVQELFRRPARRFVAEFLGGTNVFPARFGVCKGTPVAVLPWATFELDESVAARDGFVQLRPDTLEVVSDQSRAHVTGTLARVSDRGIYCDLTVTVGADVTLRAHVRPETGARLVVGDAISLRCARPVHPMVE